MSAALQLVFLFTDIEGSTRLWEQQRDAMRAALAAHDALVAQVLAAHRGRLVKRTGDGVHAVFDDALDAVLAAGALQCCLAEPTATAGLSLAVRCGLHAGADEARDQDFYGPDVNRAARIMAAAHGGQVLLSQRVADAVAGRLPAHLHLQPLGQVRLRDLLRPEPLHQLAGEGLRSGFPPLRSLEATPNNLGTQLSRFIGRAQLLAELQQRVRHERLVTLFGPGGIGKTRLSLQLAADALDAHPDGVWFVELAPLVAGPEAQARLLQMLAATLGVKEQPGQALADTLCAQLQDRRLLLVLDNCEHLLAATAAVVKQLLQAAPGLHILASSREVLRVAGEAVFAVPALSLPEPADVARGPQRLMAHEAVRLFVDRAMLSRADFRLDADNAAAVAEICQRVEGIPLAIELAAARVRALPVRAVAERLRESFRLLATRDETVAPRQRTLAHLIDWSHDMLSPPERVLYRRLSVFSGGFSLAAAEAVCADGQQLQTDEVLDLLAWLVEKSLVAQADDRSAPAAAGPVGTDAAGLAVPPSTADEPAGRWRMLETVRQHAAERLHAAEGTAHALRQRQLAHYAALAQEASAAMRGPDHDRWLRRLDTEGENILGVLSWSADTAGSADLAASGLAIAVALRPYWISRGLLSLALDSLERLMAQADPALGATAKARGLLSAGQMCIFMGRHAQACGHLEASLAIYQAEGQEAAAQAVRQPLGIAALGLGDTAQARGHFEAAEQSARQAGNPRQLAVAVNAVAQIDRLDGRLAAADRRYAEFIALARQMGNSEYRAVGLVNRAMVALMSGRPQAVPATVLAAARLADANGSKPLLLSVIDTCAGLAAAVGDWDRVAWCIGLAQTQARHAGLVRDAVDEAFITPAIGAARQALGEAGFAACSDEGARSPFKGAWLALETWLAALDAQVGGQTPLDERLAPMSAAG